MLRQGKQKKNESKCKAKELHRNKNFKIKQEIPPHELRESSEA